MQPGPLLFEQHFSIYHITNFSKYQGLFENFSKKSEIIFCRRVIFVSLHIKYEFSSHLMASVNCFFAAVNQFALGEGNIFLPIVSVMYTLEAA